MARPLRVEYPGAYYHVINRGNNQENIFLNDRDKQKFLEYLAKAHQQLSEGFILGDLDFVNWVKKTFLSSRPDDKEISQLKKLKPKVQLEAVVKAVCEEFACEAEQIIAKGRKKNKAREVAIHLARDLSGVSCKHLGLYFGGVSGALITIMYNRIAQEVEQNRRFNHRIVRIKKQILNI